METQQILMRTLVVVVVMTSVIWRIAGEYPKAHSCCITVSRHEVTDPIIGFRLQNRNPPCVKAIILITERGELCVHWRDSWVKEKINQFRAQKKKLAETRVVTSTPTPTSSSISDITHAGGEKKKKVVKKWLVWLWSH